MPIQKVKRGYKYGKAGKVYKQKSKVLRQMRAIKANQSKRKS